MLILYFSFLLQESVPTPPPSREQQLQAEIEEAVFTVQQGFEAVGRYLRTAQGDADKNQVAPLLENLETASQMGWFTFWIHPNFSDGNQYKYVTRSFSNIKDCLRYLETKY